MLAGVARSGEFFSVQRSRSLGSPALCSLLFHSPEVLLHSLPFLPPCSQMLPLVPWLLRWWRCMSVSPTARSPALSLVLSPDPECSLQVCRSAVAPPVLRRGITHTRSALTPLLPPPCYPAGVSRAAMTQLLMLQEPMLAVPTSISQARALLHSCPNQYFKIFRIKHGLI